MKKTSSVLMIFCFVFSLFISVKAEPSFVDVGEDYWAKEYIDFICQKGIITDATHFYPEKNISRGDFIMAVVRTFEIDKVAYADAFEDVEKDIYYADYIQTAFDYGLFCGSGNRLCEPNRLISRQEMVSIVMRSYDLIRCNTKSQTTFEYSFMVPDDWTDVSEWAQDDVKSAYEKNIVLGFTDQKFYPNNYATRAEAATVIVRTIKLCINRGASR